MTMLFSPTWQCTIALPFWSRDMDIVNIVKSHWPVAVGGVVGLYLVVKFMGKGSSPQVVYTGGGAAPNSGNSQALENQAAQIALQGQALTLQAGLARDKMMSDAAINNSIISAETAASNNAAQIGWLGAQGQVAQNVAGAASQVITALELPSIAAINSSAAADAATVKAASDAASAGYLSQASIFKSLAGTASNSNNNVATATSNAVKAGSASDGAMWNTLGSVASIASFFL